MYYGWNYRLQFMIHCVQITKWLEEEGVQLCDVEIVVDTELALRWALNIGSLNAEELKVQVCYWIVCGTYNNIHLVLFSALQLYVIVAVLLFCLQVYWDAPLFTSLMIFISVKWQIYYQVHMYILIVWHIRNDCFMGMPIGYVTAITVKEIHR